MKRTILVVDDNDEARLLLRDILTYHGYAALEAKNGAEGVDMARKNMPDLVLMDIQMPVMDGLTACRILKEDPLTCGLRVIALTSFAMKGDRERIMSAGFEGYLTKPLDTRTLPQQVRKWLEGEGTDLKVTMEER